MDKCNVPLDYTHMRTVLPIVRIEGSLRVDHTARTTHSLGRNTHSTLHTTHRTPHGTLTVCSQQLFKRWESVKLMTSLVSMPDLRWCPSCQEPAFMTPGCSAVSCPVCDFEFCPTCMLPKHAAIRCSAVRSASCNT